MHPNPNPNPNSIPPAPDPVYSSHYAYYSQNPPLSIPFPHVYPDPSPAELKPPGVDSYPPASSVPQVTQPPAVSYVQEYPASSNYYGAYPTGYVGSASVPVAQEGLQQLAVVQPTTLWTNYVYQPQGNKNPYKREKRKKKTKVVQSAYCEVCKVDCNSKDVLETHKSGKKHKKILESVSVAQAGLQQQLAAVQPTEGNENSNKHQKKTKVVQSAYCEVCKVDCNSKDVLEMHKLGKKHKKILERVSVAHEGLQQQVAVAQPTSTLANNVDQLQGNENPNNCQNEIKAVPSAYCEVCKVDCKSKEVLDQHKLGKKHKKRLESVSVGQEGLQQQLAVLQPASTLDNYGYEPQGDESSNKSHEKEKSVSVAQEGLEQQLEVAQPASTLDNYGYEPQGNKVSNKSQEEAKSVLVAQEGLQHQLAVAQPTSTLDNYGYDAQGNESSNKSQDKAKSVLVAQEGLQQQLAVAQPSSTLDNYGYEPQGNESSNKSQEEAKSVPVAQDGLQQAQPASTLVNNIYKPQGTENSNKSQEKTSAYCELCKVDCNNNYGLHRHNMGKKHKKNLDKLQAAAAEPGGSSDSVQRAAKKKATEPLEDLETKRRKILESGAAQEAVKVCAICNVVCNSEGAYNFHLAGKKHAMMLKKYLAGASLVAAT